MFSYDYYMMYSVNVYSGEKSVVFDVIALSQLTKSGNCKTLRDLLCIFGMP